MKQKNTSSFKAASLLGITAAILQSSATAALVHHWEFEEGTGTTAADSAGANPGAISGATWSSDGVRSSFLTFNGTTSDIVNPALTLAAHSDTSTFTWAVWVLNSTAANNNDVIIGNRRDGTGAEFTPRQFTKVTVRQAEWHVNANGNDNLAWTQGSGTPLEIPVGTWTHLAVVKDGTTLTTYENGVQTGTKTLAESLASTSAMPFFIGGDAGSNDSEHFAGGIDDVRIYSTALDASEIATIAGVPEPSSFLLAALGLGMTTLRRKR